MNPFFLLGVMYIDKFYTGMCTPRVNRVNFEFMLTNDMRSGGSNVLYS